MFPWERMVGPAEPDLEPSPDAEDVCGPQAEIARGPLGNRPVARALTCSRWLVDADNNRLGRKDLALSAKID
jgi:hypothetical protein